MMSTLDRQRLAKISSRLRRLPPPLARSLCRVHKTTPATSGRGRSKGRSQVGWKAPTLLEKPVRRAHGGIAGGLCGDRPTGDRHGRTIRGSRATQRGRNAKVAPRRGIQQARPAAVYVLGFRAQLWVPRADLGRESTTKASSSRLSQPLLAARGSSLSSSPGRLLTRHDSGRLGHPEGYPGPSTRRISEPRALTGMTNGENCRDLLRCLSTALAMTEAAYLEARRRRDL